MTGVDFSPELLAIARERAADAMVEVEWVEADVQDLPFEDASFDRVISTFGHMFAADHEATAAEMKRVCRPAARSASAAGRPTGSIGRMFQMVAGLMPPPPGSSSPLLWGTEEHVRELLGDGRAGAPERRVARLLGRGYADFMLESFGPLLNAREVLGARGGELRTEYLAFLEQENLADDGTLRFEGEYLSAVINPRP